MKRTSDLETISMCSRHHAERHAFAGVFRGGAGDQMRSWLDAQVGWTRKRLQPFTEAA